MKAKEAVATCIRDATPKLICGSSTVESWQLLWKGEPRGVPVQHNSTADPCAHGCPAVLVTLACNSTHRARTQTGHCLLLLYLYCNCAAVHNRRATCNTGLIQGKSCNTSSMPSPSWPPAVSVKQHTHIILDPCVHNSSVECV